MPQDLICRKCDYTMSIGWYHYHDLSSGYWARTAFACGKCGITHYVEHATDEDKQDRYLYHDERSTWSEDMDVSMPPDGLRESTDLFTCFEDFTCPGCRARGSVITTETLEIGVPDCPLCGSKLEELGFWMT